MTRTARRPSASRLREAAEGRLRARPGDAGDAAGPTDLEDSQRLVHELRVHEAELELQNEELERTRGEAEAALARYAELYDSAPVGYATLDAAGAIVELNLACAALLGGTRDALVGALLPRRLVPGSRRAFEEFLAGALASRTRVALEVSLERPDGAALPVHLEALAAPQPSERELVRVALVDMSEVRRLEVEVREARRLEAIALLAAGVAHEINNPLSYLLEGVGFMERELQTPAPDVEELRATLRDERDGLERIRDIVRSLRAFSGPEVQTLLPVDPSAELGAALRLAQNQLRHRATVEKRLGPLPQVLARPHELGQAFLALLVNAAQACPEDRAGNLVTVATSTDDAGWARIDIADSGVGMSAATLARAFEPFFTTKPPGMGTGLGLAVVQGIVAGAGGRVEVESAPGKGSTFRVLLPPAVAPAPRPATAPGGAEEDAATRRRVLVVDDLPAVARSTARALRRGCTATVCCSGAEALAILAGGARFDAIVCDLMMPGMSGPVLHERVAERWPDQAERFIFLTGGPFGEASTAFAGRTPLPVLEKPCGEEELLAAVRRVAAT